MVGMKPTVPLMITTIAAVATERTGEERLCLMQKMHHHEGSRRYLGGWRLCHQRRHCLM